MERRAIREQPYHKMKRRTPDYGPQERPSIRATGYAVLAAPLPSAAWAAARRAIGTLNGEHDT